VAGAGAGPRTMWRESSWVTMSGMFALPTMNDLVGELPVDVVLLSIDYPLSNTLTGKQFMLTWRDSGLVVEEELRALRLGILRLCRGELGDYWSTGSVTL